MTEDEIKATIRAYFGLRPDIKLFTNPVGNGWMANSVKSSAGGIFLRHPRRVGFGLCPGSPDLIGWITINNKAIFLAFEVKTISNTATHEQLNFIEQVKAAGGIAGVVRSIEDCDKLIEDYKTKAA